MRERERERESYIYIYVCIGKKDERATNGKLSRRKLLKIGGNKFLQRELKHTTE